MNTKFDPKRRGFTLIELLMVIVIIMILAGITTRVIVYVNRQTGRGRAVSEIERLKNALSEYHSTFGIYPPVNSTILPPAAMTMRWIWTNNPAIVPVNYGCYTGLSYYLWSSDVAERERWSHYIQGMDSDSTMLRSNFVGGWVFWTNGMKSCYDPWGNDYRYESFAPFQACRLWSLGPNVTNSLDDIGISWAE